MSLSSNKVEKTRKEQSTMRKEGKGRDRKKDTEKERNNGEEREAGREWMVDTLMGLSRTSPRKLGHVLGVRKTCDEEPVLQEGGRTFFFLLFRKVPRVLVSFSESAEDNGVVLESSSMLSFVAPHRLRGEEELGLLHHHRRSGQ